MRAKTWSLFVAGVVLGASMSTVGCAGKSKPSAAPPAPTPKATPPRPPPDMLTMKVDATPPKAPPPPVKTADPCVMLQDRLASLLVHFDVDRSTLNTSAVAEVDAVSETIKRGGVGPNVNFRIEGHCDATGSDEYNIALSERRANTVLGRLADLGTISPNHAVTIPWGKQKPLDPAATPEAYTRNRRVEILVNCPAR
jgi:outer membrane protein OmpA-like peptidoglycan-associated protein